MSRPCDYDSKPTVAVRLRITREDRRRQSCQSKLRRISHSRVHFAEHPLYGETNPCPASPRWILTLQGEMDESDNRESTYARYGVRTREGTCPFTRVPFPCNSYCRLFQRNFEIRKKNHAQTHRPAYEGYLHLAKNRKSRSREVAPHTWGVSGTLARPPAIGISHDPAQPSFHICRTVRTCQILPVRVVTSAATIDVLALTWVNRKPR